MKHTLEPAMDNFINARTQEITCWWFPLNVYFKNSKAGWYLPFVDALCHFWWSSHTGSVRSPTMQSCCLSELCLLHSPHLVALLWTCDLHNPTSFELFKVTPRKSDQLPSWSWLDLGYKMTLGDCKLWIAKNSGCRRVRLQLSLIPVPWSACHNNASHLPMVQAMVHHKIELRQIQGPPCLSLIELLHSHEVFKVFMVCPNLEFMLWSLQEVVPLF